MACLINTNKKLKLDYFVTQLSTQAKFVNRKTNSISTKYTLEKK